MPLIVTRVQNGFLLFERYRPISRLDFRREANSSVSATTLSMSSFQIPLFIIFDLRDRIDKTRRRRKLPDLVYPSFPPRDQLNFYYDRLQIVPKKKRNEREINLTRFDR